MNFSISLKQTIGPITAATFVFATNYSVAQASPSYRADCDPVARNYNTGKIICKNDVLNGNSSYKLFCFLNQQWVNVTHVAVVGNFCSRNVVNRDTLKRCTQFNTNNEKCGTAKGDNAIGKPEIIKPYTGILMNKRPDFEWVKVPGATSYFLEVSGNNLAWSRQTSATALAYPTDQPALVPGEVYRIVTTALAGSRLLSAESMAVTTLSTAEANQVQEQVNNVTQRGFSADEAAYLDLDAIYRSHNLYTETISNLKARVSSGSQDPNLYLVLANRYCQVGLPQLSRQLYDRGMMLAQKQDNPFVIQRIKLALARLTTSSPLE